ncbi:MFS transporter [Pseudonocardia acaciae]|uniref:MFS transporter n=1 Tax=Pseudonocardia acaciae TaxID=551276 RepID=UPI000688417B|nr:MFS transporter [Pseudonocardia acaciae]
MAAPGSATTDTGGRKISSTRIIAAASIGNALEWYDISAYAVFAVYISKAFFTNSDPAVSLMLALGTFAVSFLIRPIGALAIGGYADRKGRKPALTLSLGLMMVGTLLICVMPTYAAIGVAAPIGILLARLIQGFAAGGEYGSATALMVEHMPHRRGFAASWQFTSQSMSTLLSGLIGTALTNTLTPEQLDSWGFRVPFIFGLLVGPVGLYIRRHMPESAEAERVIASGERATPVTTLFAQQKLLVLLAIGIMAVTTCVNYMITYIPTFSVQQLKLPASSSFVCLIVSAVLLIAVTPVVGHLSDRYGQLNIMIPASILLLVLIFPMFALMVGLPTLGVLLVVVGLLSLLKGAYFGPMAAVLAMLFPTGTRATGQAVGYNIGVAIFGGFTPLVATWLIKTTSLSVAPSFWVIVAGVVSLTSLIVIRKRLGMR